MKLVSYFKSAHPEPTEDQLQALQLIEGFISSKGSEIFILSGYAGTGKTTLIPALVKFLSITEWSCSLLAPTGRAAKVMQQYAKTFASTIHRHIYRKENIPGALRFALSPNRSSNCVYIVDEASMIGKSKGRVFGHDLLDDLISYVQDGINCKLILVGDPAQLPPVGSSESPALNAGYMSRYSRDRVKHCELKSVVRQALDSGILYNATVIRKLIEQAQTGFPKFELGGFADIEAITGQDLQEALENAYNEYGMEETVVLTRSNKMANTINNEIRNRLLYREEEISGGDLLMVVKNNYYWTAEYKNLGFIANGDTLEVIRVRNDHSLYGFNFLDITCRLRDYEDEPELELRIITQSLQSNGPSMTKEENNQLIKEIAEDYPEITDRKKKWMKIKESPFFNAVQVKYGYAITGHKSQGGQWDCVFVDQSFFREEMLDIDYLRWLYTAFTRARKKLFLVNFHPHFFK